MDNRSEEILIRLTTEQLSEEAKSHLLQQIKDDEEAMETYHLIMGTDKLAEQNLLEMPSANFATRVVSSYERTLVARNNNSLLWIFSFVSVGLLMTIIVFVGAKENGAVAWNPFNLDAPEVKYFTSSMMQAGMQIFTSTQLIMGIVIINAILIIMMIDIWLRKHLLKIGMV